MSAFIVTVGNFARTYGPFETEAEARQWADVAEYTGLTRNGTMGITIMPLTAPAKAWAFKVRVEITPCEGEWFDRWYTVSALDFDEAEVKGIAKAKAEFPGGHLYVAFDTAVRN